LSQQGKLVSRAGAIIIIVIWVIIVVAVIWLIVRALEK
jgi:hypothetical protein